MDGIEEMSNQGTTLKNHLPKAQKKESKVVVLIGLDLLVCLKNLAMKITWILEATHAA